MRARPVSGDDRPRPGRRILCTTALVVVLSAPAWAATVLLTAPVLRPGKVITCLAGNVGTKPITVRIDPVFEDGTAESGFVATIDPSNTRGFGVNTIVGTAEAYCRFTVDSGSARNLRGSYCVSDTLFSPFCDVTGDAR